jgi:hypothetical protein
VPLVKTPFHVTRALSQSGTSAVVGV